MKHLLSVIVPIYNAEAYMDRCIDSILASTYQELELILVDDGSNDQSLEMCREYEAKDARVRVFHKENGGMCSARNMGLENATGKYIAFVDNDDFVAPTMYEKLINIIETKDVMIAECGWVEFDEAGAERPGYLKRYGRMNLSKIRSGELLNDSRSVGSGFIWNSVFDYERLKENAIDIRFDSEMFYYEDINFQMKLCGHNKGYFYVDEECLYHYLIRSSSFSHTAKTVDDDLQRAADTLTTVQLVRDNSSWINYKRALGNYYNTKLNIFFNNLGDTSAERWQHFKPGKAFAEGFDMFIFSWRFPAYYYKWLKIMLARRHT